MDLETRGDKQRNTERKEYDSRKTGEKGEGVRGIEVKHSYKTQ